MDSSVFDDSLRVDVLEHGGFCDINYQAAVKQKRIKREAKEEEQRIWETLSAEGRRTQPQPIAPGEHFDNTHPCTRGQKTSPESVANIATDNRRKMQLEKLSGAELSSLLKIRGDSHKEGGKGSKNMFLHVSWLNQLFPHYCLQSSHHACSRSRRPMRAKTNTTTILHAADASGL